jgi:uncharacterized protein with PQ loop repeat
MKNTLSFTASERKARPGPPFHRCAAEDVHVNRLKRATFTAFLVTMIPLLGCGQQLTPQHMERLFKPGGDLSEIVGFLAGLGTTFAAVPDLLAMLKRRSSAGMNPRMGTIMGAFQVLWVYYGLLIASRPVILWNIIAVLINFLTVGAYSYFLHKEKFRSDKEVVVS